MLVVFCTPRPLLIEQSLTLSFCINSSAPRTLAVLVTAKLLVCIVSETEQRKCSTASGFSFFHSPNCSNNSSNYINPTQLVWRLPHRLDTDCRLKTTGDDNVVVPNPSWPRASAVFSAPYRWSVEREGQQCWVLSHGCHNALWLSVQTTRGFSGNVTARTNVSGHPKLTSGTNSAKLSIPLF